MCIKLVIYLRIIARIEIFGKEHVMKKSCLLLTFMALVIPCTARTITVDANGSADFTTIQAAIDDANDGDEIVVADGIYTGAGNRDIDFLGLAITVMSENGPNDCIIDCNGTAQDNHRGFFFHSGEDANSILDGFTIKNGYYYSEFSFPIGGGIACRTGTEPTIRNCIVTDNEASHGGGIGCFRSNPRIMNCIISKNSAGSHFGGGIYFDHSFPNITGCTIVNNSAVYGGGAVYLFYSHPKINNSIIWNNISATGRDEIDPGGPQHHSTVTISYCDIKGGYPGTGNINTDPCFVDTDANDFHLLPGSQCINSGDPNYVLVLEPNETDLDFESRIMGGRIDIGADEFYSDISYIWLIREIIDFNADQGRANPVPQTLSICNSGIGIINWEIVEDCGWLEVNPNTGSSTGEVNDVNISVDITGLAWGVYYYDLTVSDSNAENSPRTVSVSLDIQGPVIELSQTQFNFIAEIGENPADQVLTVSNIGGGTLDWQVSESCSWLTVEPNSGSSTGETDDVNLSVDISGLSAGNYYCALTISDPNAENNPQTVAVNLQLSGPTIDLSATQFQFAALEGGVNPEEQILSVSNSGVGILNWQISGGCSWLSVEPNSGSSTGEVDDVSLSVDTSGLVVGVYDCNLTISGGNDATNSPSSVHIELLIYEIPVDFGDAPDPPYPTLLASDGPYHVAAGPTLGNNRDIDLDGQPNATATGDDIAADDDEDGITDIKTGWAGGDATVTVTVTNGPAYLSGWIDWDKSGDWNGPGELVVNNVLVPSGTTVVSLTGAPGAALKAYPIYSRWRISTAGGLSYTGPAADGEVEDYDNVDCSCSGEITGNGKVTATDMVQIATWIGTFGTGRPRSIPSSDTEHYYRCADVDNDGDIDATDITKIATWLGRYGSGRPKSIICPHSYP